MYLLPQITIPRQRFQILISGRTDGLPQPQYLDTRHFREQDIFLRYDPDGSPWRTGKVASECDYCGSLNRRLLRGPWIFQHCVRLSGKCAGGQEKGRTHLNQEGRKYLFSVSPSSSLRWLPFGAEYRRFESFVQVFDGYGYTIIDGVCMGAACAPAEFHNFK